jgi:hypothetical protein
MAIKEAKEPRSAAYSCAQSVYFMFFSGLNIVVDAAGGKSTMQGEIQAFGRFLGIDPIK